MVHQLTVDTSKASILNAEFKFKCKLRQHHINHSQVKDLQILMLDLKQQSGNVNLSFLHAIIILTVSDHLSFIIYWKIIEVYD